MKQQEYIYPGAINKLHDIIVEHNPKNILLVRGNNSFIKSGVREALLPTLENYSVCEFTGFSVNPKLEEAQIGFDLFKNSKSSIIIAVGGGSVIDTAKIIKYLAIKENRDNSSIPFIAIPTTAGTGSEATHFAVVYINGEKHSWANEALIPTFAIVDASLHNGQSNYQMAVSGIDAFAQGIESMWSVNSTEESRKYSAKAIKLIWENLEDAINENKDALVRIAEGANWAGKAINIAKTTAPHALSYGFTSKFGLPHGHAVALFLPFFFLTHKKVNEENCKDTRGKEWTFNIMTKISAIINVKMDELEQHIQLFISDCGINTNFQELGITKSIFKELIENVNQDRMYNNPVLIKNNQLISYWFK